VILKMGTISLTISYRPVRIGFLVKEGDIDGFLNACEINTLLWGGIYNPIIPVGSNTYLTKQLIKLFSVDVFYSMNGDNEIKEVIAEYPYLKSPYHITEEIFYEDWYSKKQLVSYLDVIHIIDHYWKEEFRHSGNSNCRYVLWKDSDNCSSLFVVLFGRYPQNLNLKFNYTNAFRNGLKAKDIEIEINGMIPESLVENITPIQLTADRLISYSGFSLREDGLYIGNVDNFNDLVTFWNLRVS
jgi:hypothetical protein